jgi:site-specific recombinase XerD
MKGKVWGPTSQHEAVSEVKRAYNWAIEEGYTALNPLATVKKAPRKRRGNLYSAFNPFWTNFRTAAI